MDKCRVDDRETTMAPSGISQPQSRSRRGRSRPSPQTRFEQALRELPLAEADITAVAGKLAAKLARYRAYYLSDNLAFFDIRGKVTAVCDHFAGDGLTLPDYLRAARRRPQLFIKSPAVVIANIERVAAHFSRYDPMRRRYLDAAVKWPSLFAMNPDKVIANVEAVIQHFAGDGLTLRQYLEACLKQPRLFCQRPAAIIGRLGYLIEMVRRGLLIIPGEHEASPEAPLAPLFAFLSQWPMCLTLADDNYALRIRYAHVTGERPEGARLLSIPRRRIEEALARALGEAFSGRQ